MAGPRDAAGNFAGGVGGRSDLPERGVAYLEARVLNDCVAGRDRNTRGRCVYYCGECCGCRSYDRSDSCRSNGTA